MKKCKRCGKLMNDDVQVCPKCNEGFHDYKSDLKQALLELDNKPKIKSKVKREDDFLNVILGFLVVAIVVVGITGAVLIGKTYVNFNPKDSIVNNDTNNQENTNNDPNNTNNEVDTNNQNDEVDTNINGNDIENSNDNNTDIQVNDGLIDIKNEENGDFEVLEFKISKEDNKVRFDIQSKTKIKGNVFLKDDKTLSIGPIAIKEGTNKLYFLINGQNNYLLQFDASNGQSYVYEISNEDIVNALKE